MPYVAVHEGVSRAFFRAYSPLAPTDRAIGDRETITTNLHRSANAKTRV